MNARYIQQSLSLVTSPPTNEQQRRIVAELEALQAEVEGLKRLGTETAAGSRSKGSERMRPATELQSNPSCHSCALREFSARP